MYKNFPDWFSVDVCQVRCGRVQKGCLYMRFKRYIWRSGTHGIVFAHSCQAAEGFVLEDSRLCLETQETMSKGKFCKKQNQAFLHFPFYPFIWQAYRLMPSTPRMSLLSSLHSHPELCWPNLIEHFLLKSTQSVNDLRTIYTTTQDHIFRSHPDTQETALLICSGSIIIWNWYSKINGHNDPLIILRLFNLHMFE